MPTSANQANPMIKASLEELDVVLNQFKRSGLTWGLLVHLLFYLHTLLSTSTFTEATFGEVQT